MNVKEAIKCGKDERRHSIFCSLATSRLTQSQKVEYPKFNFSQLIGIVQGHTQTLIVVWNTFTSDLNESLDCLKRKSFFFSVTIYFMINSNYIYNFNYTKTKFTG